MEDFRDRAENQGWLSQGGHWARAQGCPTVIVGPLKVYGKEAKFSEPGEIPGWRMKDRVDTTCWRQETSKGRAALLRCFHGLRAGPGSRHWLQGEGVGRGKSWQVLTLS